MSVLCQITAVLFLVMGWCAAISKVRQTPTKPWDIGDVVAAVLVCGTSIVCAILAVAWRTKG